MTGLSGKTLLRSQLAASLVCWAAVVVCSFFAYRAGWLEGVDNDLYDLAMSLRGEIPTSGLVTLVLMDEKSALRLQRQRGQWSRSTLAQALDNLCGAGAGVVGIDMVMAAPDPDPEEDRQLAAAMGRCNNVVLARVSSARTVAEIVPQPRLARAMIGDGFIDVPLDGDGVLRKIRYLNAKPLPGGGWNCCRRSPWKWSGCFWP